MVTAEKSRQLCNTPYFSIQWHLTNECDQRCQHCYIFQKDVKKPSKELSTRECFALIDSIIEFCKILEATPTFFLTGGDPLLRKDFFQILEYLFKKNIISRVMGNPFHLTKENIHLMRNLGVVSYQLSLDGLEKTHDQIRKIGSYKSTIKGFELLKEAGMHSVLMFTLSKLNVDDLIGVIEIADSMEINLFSFARYTEQNFNGLINEQYTQEMFNPQEYRTILLNVQNKARELQAKGSKTQISLKDNLWKLLLFEQGLWHPIKNNDDRKIFGGCFIGRSGFNILPDGEVYACRRFYSPIGNILEQSVAEIFTSPVFDKYRDIEKIEKCSNCELLYHCRGCRAAAFSVNGDFLKPDPQCWR